MASKKTVPDVAHEAAPSAAPDATPQPAPAMPAHGGCYTRNPDGSLTLDASEAAAAQE